MISKIHLENFLSYRDVTVRFKGSTISVVGENGSGKSSLLESIPYVYFGISRDSMEGMSRLNGDGTHKVTLWEDDGTVISRGRRKSGSGFFQIRVNNELVAKGREADEWVKSHLGMDGDTFMLTAFFGLHDVWNDKLIRVTPANRLEALQKLAEIGPYTTMLKRAKKAYSDSESDKLKYESKKSGAEAGRVNEKDTLAKIDESKAMVLRLDSDREDFRSKKDKLLTEINKYQAFVKEKSELSVERRNLDKDIVELEEELSDIGSVGAENKKISEESVKQRDTLIAKNKKVDIDTREKIIVELTKEYGQLEGRLHLLSNIESSDSSLTECPLCSAAVPENQVAMWKEELEEIKGHLNVNKQNAKEIRISISQYHSIADQISDLQATIDSAVSQSKHNAARAQEIDRELRKLRADKSKKDDRFIDLQEKLGDEYQQIHTELSNTSEEMENLTGQIEAEKREIKVLQGVLDENKQIDKLISKWDLKIKELRSKMKAYKILTEAWSRYGIPMILVKDIMKSIEEKATSVYQEFDSGRILVSEVIDRGKPGVDFILQDRKGNRSFTQLSAGEKLMFYISVRVAISQIVSENNPVSVDYLVLDEAMGNLSPKRRDDLIRMSNKILRKLFPQLLIVSHTEMRDIFTTTIRVISNNDESTVQVLS